MTVQRDFLVLMTLAAAAVPALAQSVTPAATSSAKTTAAGAPIPNLSGVWAHPFLTGFEPPASGPGPVLNTQRRPNGTSNFQKLVGDYKNPILNPGAAEAVRKHGELSLSGVGYQTPSNQCWPGGVPYVFWDFIVQVLQQPDQVTMIYRHGNEVRRVRLNDKHPAKVTPSWYGDSVGHYEGDALVVDTIGMKLGPYSMLDMYGTPKTEKLHVVERYRLIDYDEAKPAVDRNVKENFQASGGAVFDRDYRGKMLQLHFTVDDENVFTMPWTATITYWPQIAEYTELICAENRTEFYHSKDSRIPTADKPDF